MKEFIFRAKELVPTVQYGNIEFEVFGDTAQEIVSRMQEVQDKYRTYYASRMAAKARKEEPKVNF